MCLESLGLGKRAAKSLETQGDGSLTSQTRNSAQEYRKVPSTRIYWCARGHRRVVAMRLGLGCSAGSRSLVDFHGLSWKVSFPDSLSLLSVLFGSLVVEVPIVGVSLLIGRVHSQEGAGTDLGNRAGSFRHNGEPAPCICLWRGWSGNVVVRIAVDRPHLSCLPRRRPCGYILADTRGLDLLMIFTEPQSCPSFFPTTSSTGGLGNGGGTRF